MASDSASPSRVSRQSSQSSLATMVFRRKVGTPHHEIKLAWLSLFASWLEIDRTDFPTLGQINQDWYGVDGKAIDERIADEYVNKLY